MNRSIVDMKYIRSRLRYNKQTGSMVWKSCRKIRTDLVGKSAANITTVSSTGSSCLTTTVDGALHRSNRLAVGLVTGSYPTERVYHIDGNIENIKYKNLVHDNMNKSLITATRFRDIYRNEVLNVAPNRDRLYVYDNPRGPGMRLIMPLVMLNVAWDGWIDERIYAKLIDIEPRIRDRSKYFHEDYTRKIHIGSYPTATAALAVRDAILDL